MDMVADKDYRQRHYVSAIYRTVWWLGQRMWSHRQTRACRVW